MSTSLSLYPTPPRLLICPRPIPSSYLILGSVASLLSGLPATESSDFIKTNGWGEEMQSMQVDLFKGSEEELLAMPGL